MKMTKKEAANQILEMALDEDGLEDWDMLYVCQAALDSAYGEEDDYFTAFSHSCDHARTVLGVDVWDMAMEERG